MARAPRTNKQPPQGDAPAPLEETKPEHTERRGRVVVLPHVTITHY